MNNSIVVVVDNYSPRIGGAELVYQRLCEGLAASGFEVEVVTTGVEGSKSSDLLHGVRITRLGRSRHGFVFHAFWELCRRQRRAEVVISSTYSSAWPAWLWAKLAGRRSVLIVHEVLGKIWTEKMGVWPGWIYRLLEKLILRLTYDRFVAVSEYTARQLIKAGVEQKKVLVILNGVDVVQPSQPDPTIRQKFGIHPERFLFLFFGRLGISKGIEVMTEACRLFLTKGYDCQLAFVTGEREHKMLQIRLEELHASFLGQVFLLPRMERNQLIGLVTAANCVLMPSRSEGFGLAGVESCTLGKTAGRKPRGGSERTSLGQSEFL